MIVRERNPQINKKLTIVVAGIASLLILAALASVNRPVAPTDGPGALMDRSTPDVWSEPEVLNSLTDAVESEFQFDGSRLYDLSYEADPDLVAFANSIGKTPACLVDLVKRQVEGSAEAPLRCTDMPPGHASNKVVIPGTYEMVCRNMGAHEVCRRVKVADHPYEQYSDAELRSLAQTSPEAAVILARRSQDDSEAEAYYERAVALSGKPGPLVEWMLHRNLGGLVRIGGALDVDKATLGYEIYLTTSRLGYGADAAAEYERILVEANIDLAPVRARANERFERLTDAREALVAAAWEG